MAHGLSSHLLSELTYLVGMPFCDVQVQKLPFMVNHLQLVSTSLDFCGVLRGIWFFKTKKKRVLSLKRLVNYQ